MRKKFIGEMELSFVDTNGIGGELVVMIVLIVRMLSIQQISRTRCRRAGF